MPAAQSSRGGSSAKKATAKKRVGEVSLAQANKFRANQAKKRRVGEVSTSQANTRKRQPAPRGPQRGGPATGKGTPANKRKSK